MSTHQHQLADISTEKKENGNVVSYRSTIDRKMEKEKLVVKADGFSPNNESSSARPQTIFVDNCSLKPKKKIKRA